jgi:hypothetical protein
MFDKISNAAEKLATNVSRRHFLGLLGRWAGASALAMAGVMTTTGSARADQGKTCCKCCTLGASFITGCVKIGNPCPTCFSGWPCNFAVSSCAQCKS